MDQEVAKEQRKTDDKKKRAVERARKIKGAGANQPSILNKLKPVVTRRMKNETRLGDQHGYSPRSGGEKPGESPVVIVSAVWEGSMVMVSTVWEGCMVMVSIGWESSVVMVSAVGE